MAFPSSIGSKSDDLQRAWDAIRSAATNVKAASVGLRNASLAGDVEGDRIVRYVALLADANDALARYTTVPGLVAYVREQINDPLIDIVAEYNTMLTQINATRTWIINNFPKDGSDYLLYHTFAATGRITPRMFSTAALAGLRTQLDLLIATID